MHVSVMSVPDPSAANAVLLQEADKLTAVKRLVCYCVDMLLVCTCLHAAAGELGAA